MLSRHHGAGDEVTAATVENTDDCVGSAPGGFDGLVSWFRNGWNEFGGTIGETLGAVARVPLTKQCLSPSLQESSSAGANIDQDQIQGHNKPLTLRDDHRNFAEGQGSAEGAMPEPTAKTVVSECSYQVDRDDLLDQHVGYYLRHHPEVHAVHAISRIRPGAYELDNREIQVEWQYAVEPGGRGKLVVVDGPLRQPFSDYMEMSEANAEYDNRGVRNNSALHNIPREQRMSFHDAHKMYSRLEAMKVAKEQAIVRERAADYVNEGREVPGELMHRYRRNIQLKLDPNARRQRHQNSPQEQETCKAHGKDVTTYGVEPL